MPIYEYQCQQCGAHREELQGINDPHLTECSACGGELKRLISSPAFQFKGSGWYVTDYGKSGSDKSGKGESKSGGKEETSSGTKGGGDSSSSTTGSGDAGAKSGSSAKAS